MSAPESQVDFYSYIHKSLRKQLFDVVAAAAALDFTNLSQDIVFASSFERLLTNLRAHGRHEDTFLHPVIAGAMPEEAERLAQAHEKQEAWLDALERDFKAAEEARSPEQGVLFARELGRFCGYYLVHLAEEEDLNGHINAKVPRQDLLAAMAAFQASRTPEEAGRDLELMLPTLNRHDRIAILSRLKTSSPPAFIFVMDIARRVLDIRTLTALETDLGIGSTGTNT